MPLSFPVKNMVYHLGGEKSSTYIRNVPLCMPAPRQSITLPVPSLFPGKNVSPAKQITVFTGKFVLRAEPAVFRAAHSAFRAEHFI